MASSALTTLGVEWWVGVAAGAVELADACEVVGISTNALDLGDPEQGREPGAAVLTCPSFFCTPSTFVMVLAHLTRCNLDFVLHVTFGRGPRASVYSVHPLLDEHSRALLAAMDPTRAPKPGELEDRARAIFARLRHDV